ncbi:MAG: hypothetical protein M5U19_20610 [Microthrixaceae bacterium]|nr:hypothetical protein [Microthrixaceae bacterium]
MSIAAVALVAASLVVRSGALPASRPEGPPSHVATRPTASRSTPALVLLMVAAVAALVLLVDPPWLITGMFAAFPCWQQGCSNCGNRICLVGLALQHRQRRQRCRGSCWSP